MIESIINSIIRKIGYIINNTVQSKIRAPEKWELINIDKECEKIDFYKEENGYWTIYYDKKRVGQISSYDLKGIDKKPYDKAMYDLIYHLETKYWIFKNRKLAIRCAKELMDLMGYWK